MEPGVCYKLPDDRDSSRPLKPHGGATSRGLTAIVNDRPAACFHMGGDRGMTDVATSNQCDRDKLLRLAMKRHQGNGCNKSIKR